MFSVTRHRIFFLVSRHCLTMQCPILYESSNCHGCNTYLNNQGVVAIQVLNHGWIGSLIKWAFGVTKVRVRMTTDNQIKTTGLGSQLHIWGISIVRQGENALDALSLKFINVFLDSNNGIRERDRWSRTGNVARRLWMNLVRLAPPPALVKKRNYS